MSRVLLPALVVALAIVPSCDGGAGPSGGTSPTPPGGSPFLRRLETWAQRFRDATRPAETLRDARDDRVAEALSAGRYPEAVALAEKLVSEGRPVGRERYFLALGLHKQQRYAEALPHFEAVLEAAPRFPKVDSVFYFYAWALYWLGRVEDAEAAFTTAGTFQAEERDVWFGRGVCRLDRSDLVGAEADLAKALRLAEAARAPRDVAKIRVRLADVALAQDDVARARQELETASTLHPELPEIWHRLARVCARLGDEAGAARAREEAERRSRR